jgi:hypothetical protein
MSPSVGPKISLTFLLFSASEDEDETSEAAWHKHISDV